MNNKSFWAIGSMLLLCSIIFQLSSCNMSTAASKPDSFTYSNVKIEVSDNSLTFKNLRIYPVYAKDNLHESEKEYGNFISLDSALKTEKVVISEKSISGRESDEVNKLFVENTSQDTIILLAGEVVKGGKQDRTLATDLVLPPGKGKKDIEVFCVEHGRWQEKDKNKQDGKPMEEKKFKQSSTALVKPSVRKNATVDKEQSKVWEKVEEVNQKANNQTTTSAYTSFDENIDYQKQEQAYLEFFKTNMKDNDRMIGVVAVSGNKVIGCDIFSTHSMFKNAWPKLLPSFINEAIYDGSVVSISDDEITKYLDQLLSNENTQKKYLEQNGKIYKHDNKVIHMSSY